MSNQNNNQQDGESSNASHQGFYSKLCDLLITPADILK